MKAQRTPILCALALGVGIALLLTSKARSSAAAQSGTPILLQASSPGTTQIGHSNISGTGLFGAAGVGVTAPAAVLDVRQGDANHTLFCFNAGVTPGVVDIYNSDAAGYFGGYDGVAGVTTGSNGWGVLGVANPGATPGVAVYGLVASSGNSNTVAVEGDNFAAGSNNWAAYFNGKLGVNGATSLKGPVTITGALTASGAATLGPLTSNNLLVNDSSAIGIAFNGNGEAGADTGIGHPSDGVLSFFSNGPVQAQMGYGAFTMSGTISTTNLTMTSGASANTVLLGASNGASSWGTVNNSLLTSDSASLSKMTGGLWAVSNGNLNAPFGNELDLYHAGTKAISLTGSNLGNIPELTLYSELGQVSVDMFASDTYGQYGYCMILDGSGFVGGFMSVSNTSGKGTVAGEVKTFVEPDPQDSRKNIVYACEEGPEAAMYMRGTSRLVNGEAAITLPEHFQKLASAEGITVELTPKSRASIGLGHEDESPDGFTVYELGGGHGNYEFAWEVTAVRRGYENWQAERPWDDALPALADKAKQWSTRLSAIAKRRQKQR